ncbi:MAG: GNAT family N-acetyltransferase, partial [Actinomycetota bacterium]|nr:GNAT family N-acetyltransferase [Actinomycetota bacterium]
MEIRPAEPSEYAAVGDLLVASYGAIEGLTVDETLADELRDVESRARDSLVLVAITAGRIVGTITYVPDETSRAAEFE